MLSPLLGAGPLPARTEGDAMDRDQVPLLTAGDGDVTIT
jgi:hypothetical protein